MIPARTPAAGLRRTGLPKNEPRSGWEGCRHGAWLSWVTTPSDFAAQARTPNAQNPIEKLTPLRG